MELFLLLFWLRNQVNVELLLRDCDGKVHLEIVQEAISFGICLRSLCGLFHGLFHDRWLYRLNYLLTSMSLHVDLECAFQADVTLIDETISRNRVLACQDEAVVRLGEVIHLLPVELKASNLTDIGKERAEKQMAIFVIRDLKIL